MTTRIDVDKPLWDQDTFVGILYILFFIILLYIHIGRFKHFAWMSNPLNGLVPSSQLMEAKQLVQEYRVGREPPGTTEKQVKLWLGSFLYIFQQFPGDPCHAVIQVCIPPRLRGASKCFW